MRRFTISFLDIKGQDNYLYVKKPALAMPLESEQSQKLPCPRTGQTGCCLQKFVFHCGDLLIRWHLLLFECQNNSTGKGLRI